MPLRMVPDASPAHRYGEGAPFRVGVEEELFLVDPTTHRPCHIADEVVREARHSRDGSIVGEMCDGMVELVTPVCRAAPEAIRRLATLRRRAMGDVPAVLMGAGVHPSQPFGDVRFRSGERYDAVSADLRGTFAQSAYCGVHVHVGLPDPDTAIAAFNGMRKWIPVLQALGANSPFWHGRDSGLASTRLVRMHSVPRTGLPRSFSDWEDYSHTVSELLRVSDADSPGAIWWDMRPQPALGTLEIRTLDTQSSLADLGGLVALTQCLVHHEALVADPVHPPKELLDEATFRALRDGLGARFSTGGPMRHVQELVAQALEISAGYAARLACRDALDEVERMLAEGNGADRQRAAHRAGGMAAVLAQLVRETATMPPTRTRQQSARRAAAASGGVLTQPALVSAGCHDLATG